ncbi:MAG: chemotaxis protein CheW [Gemmataceae bacterium]
MLALLFQVGTERVAVDVHRVREVVPRVRLSSPPGGPPWLAGQFVYRGRVVPVIDLHAVAGCDPCPPHLSSRIMLFEWPASGDTLVGLLATQVAEIREVTGATTVPGGVETPALGPAVPDGAGLLRILDPDRLFAKLAPHSAGLISPRGGV